MIAGHIYANEESECTWGDYYSFLITIQDYEALHATVCGICCVGFSHGNSMKCDW